MNRRFLEFHHWGNSFWGNSSLMTNLQRKQLRISCAIVHNNSITEWRLWKQIAQQAGTQNTDDDLLKWRIWGWGNSEKVFSKFFKQLQWKSSTHNTENVKSWGIRTRFLVKTVVDDPVPTAVTVLHLVWSGLVFKPKDTQSRDTQSLPYSPWAKDTQSSPNTRGKSSGQTSKPSQTRSPGDPQLTAGLL